MQQCVYSTPVQVNMCSPPVEHSVHHYGMLEASEYKWIESEKAGRDLGIGAIRCWVREHWNGFLRARWMEHLQGRRFWIELDQDDFGLLIREFKSSALIDPILEQLIKGEENLGVLNWAIDNDLPTEEVLQILEALDINSRRIEFILDSRLANER